MHLELTEIAFVVQLHKDGRFMEMSAVVCITLSVVRRRYQGIGQHR